MNPFQDVHQTSIKMLIKNWWNVICTKVLENYHLTSNIPIINLHPLEKDRKSEQAASYF